MTDSTHRCITYPNRREFLWQYGGGLGGVALASILMGEMPEVAKAQGVGVHHPPSAKRVVQLFMSGAASQCDLFDYKPLLASRNGEPWDPGESVELFQSQPGKTMAAPWRWRQYGECDKHLSDIVAPLGTCVDEIAFIHNLTCPSNVHGPATFFGATGFTQPGFPAAGAWITYALGSETENLPDFVVLPDPRGFAPNGPKNWSSGFLPAAHQGTLIRPHANPPMHALFPPDETFIDDRVDRASLDVLLELNRAHAQERPGDSRLEARIRSYELAARMQLAAPESLSLRGEPDSVLKLYGLNRDAIDHPRHADGISRDAEIEHYGRKCLVARRLLERGVRFVQVWSGADNAHPRRNWDSHEDLARDHGPLAWGMAVGASGLIRDLKQRGLLDETIVVWTTEFGRMPCSQGASGRDHNPFVFTSWLAGGGVRGGTSYGPSDDWSYKPADRDHPTHIHDVHATVLYLLGIDHERLTFRHSGIDRRLTDVHGRVIEEII
jgi:hypothetical protein